MMWQMLVDIDLKIQNSESSIMSKITINIDGKEVETQEGEFILNAARANDIFIPAICYLTRCSPTLACRICLVEADGKQVYACNAKKQRRYEHYNYN